MKSKRPGPGFSLRRGVQSPRLTAVLLVAIAVFSLVGRWVSGAIGTGERLDLRYSPQTLFLFDLFGLRDFTSSGWFIFVCLLLILNLLVQAIARLGPAWRHAFRAMPAYPPQEDEHPPIVVHELDCAAVRDKFPGFGKAALAAAGLRAQVLHDESGLEVQVTGQRGRFSELAHRLGILFAVAGVVFAVLGAWLGFQGRVTVGEGERVGFFQLTGGFAGDRPVLKTQGNLMPGFYELGFSVECRKIATDFVDPAGRARGARGNFAFLADGADPVPRRIAPFKPVRFGGLSFHAAGFAPARDVGLRLEIRDRQAGEATPRSLLTTFAETQPLEGGATFRVTDLREADDDVGASAELEYVEPPRAAERFWIFQRYPAYDFVHRKQSRFIFAINAMEPRLAAVLNVARDAWLPYATLCLCLAAIGLAYSLRVPHERIWLVWTPGTVAFAAWSNRPEWAKPAYATVERELRCCLRPAGSKDKVADDAV